jgi:hypothetical protein
MVARTEVEPERSPRFHRVTIVAGLVLALFAVVVLALAAVGDAPHTRTYDEPLPRAAADSPGCFNEHLAVAGTLWRYDASPKARHGALIALRVSYGWFHHVASGTLVYADGSRQSTSHSRFMTLECALQ